MTKIRLATEADLVGLAGVTDLTVTPAPTTVTVVSSTGTDAVLAAATGTNAGLLLPAEKTKLTSNVLTVPTPWATATPYLVNDLLYTSTGLLVLTLLDHTSGAGEPSTDSSYFKVIGVNKAYVESWASLRPGAPTHVYKDETTGFWPGGTANSWTRPTARTDIYFVLIGPEPSPPIVTAPALGGMYNRDLRHISAT